MPTITLQAAIADFLRSGQQLHADPQLTGERVLEAMIAGYMRDRVDGADTNEDEDMLLFQWGASGGFDLVTPTDFRLVPDEELRFFEEKVQYLNCTRQVFAPNGNRDLEFDDDAVGLSITLYYGLATGDEPNANLWVSSPDDILLSVDLLRSVPFVASLLTRPASRTNIIVSNVG